jgi:hypothetical protein
MAKAALMRQILVLTLLISSLSSSGQGFDSIWIANNYVRRFIKDTGQFLTDAKFIDEAGTVKSLKDFAGKLVYIDVWTTCFPTILDCTIFHLLSRHQ